MHKDHINKIEISIVVSSRIEKGFKMDKLHKTSARGDSGSERFRSRNNYVKLHSDAFSTLRNFHYRVQSRRENVAIFLNV